MPYSLGKLLHTVFPFLTPSPLERVGVRSGSTRQLAEEGLENKQEL